jgi:hypothetical protein
MQTIRGTIEPTNEKTTIESVMEEISVEGDAKLFVWEVG